MNRLLAAHFASYSYKTAGQALACKGSALRIKLQNGTWKFMFAACDDIKWYRPMVKKSEAVRSVPPDGKGIYLWILDYSAEIAAL